MKETLEEFINSQPYYGTCTSEYLEGIEEGAKWQQEQDKNKYSEEDLRKAFSAGRTVYNYKGEWEETYSDQMTSSKYEDFIEWFKQFKNK